MFDHSIVAAGADAVRARRNNALLLLLLELLPQSPAHLLSLEQGLPPHPMALNAVAM